jgi:asparagine synthetase B (glutamine-hydrolysing)
MNAELAESYALVTGRQPRVARWMASFGETESGTGLRLLNNEAKSVPDFASRSGCSVLFEGVLYNPQALLNGSATSEVRKNVDIVLDSYLRLGEKAFEKMEGIYSVILWDRNRESLMCLRDRLGVYSLFYADAGPEILFSGSIEALTSHPKVTTKLNRAALADHLRHRYPSLEETFQANVKRVPPGSVLRITRNNRSTHRYWNPVPYGGNFKWADEEELQTFDSLLEKAVSRFLEIGPAGIFLSGGLDSVSVAAVAAERCRRDGMTPPLALSIVFPDPACNEENVQRSVASNLGLSQVIVPYDSTIGSGGTLQTSIELSRNWHAPPLGFNLAPYLYLALEGKKRGYPVILTGGGGDEWLTVSPSYGGDLLSRFDLIGFYRFARHIKRSWPTSNKALMRNLWLFAARPMIASRVRRILKRVAPNQLKARQMRKISEATPPWIAPDVELRKEIDDRAEKVLGMVPGKDGLYMFDQRLSLDHPLVSMEMEDYYETGQRLGVRWLQPFWDADLASLLCRSKPELLYKDGRSKAQVREVIHRRFPDLGFDRQKKVRGGDFFRAMLVREGPAILKSTGGMQALSELGIVDSKLIHEKMNGILANPKSRELYRIWELLNLEAWVRPRV